MEYRNKRFMILGLKKTGLSTIRFLKTINPLKIYITDQNLKIDLSDTTYIEYDEAINYLDKIDYLVKSPGIPYDIPILEKAHVLNIPIINDIEIAYHYIEKNKKIIGITGSNGKTTTTTILERLLREANIKALSVGNIGKPLLDALQEDNNEVDVYVLELSSFQLLDIHEFNADINIFLNITSAHLDYHHTFDHYLNAKLNLIKNLHSDSIIIYNLDDEILNTCLSDVNAHKYTFSLINPEANIYIDDDMIIYNKEQIMNVHDIKLLGKHNLYNIMPCIIVGKLLNVDNKVIRSAITNFVGLPHRLEHVKTINNISFYNDSKSTNVASTLSALASFNQAVILLLGGYDRGQEFEEIIKHKKTKLVIAFGATKDRIKMIAEKENKICLACESIEETVKVAYRLAKPNDIILFSPASASWDEFPDYEVRGDYFKRIVNNLPNNTNLEDAYECKGDK